MWVGQMQGKCFTAVLFLLPQDVNILEGRESFQMASTIV